MISSAMANPGQGDAEHESERTAGCVSDRVQATTRAWAARDGVAGRQ
jgi:hypothetical protein